MIEIFCNDCLEQMKKMSDNSISCIVTDPPYGLGFMGKDWDEGLPHADIWKEALRIVKPGGHMLCFGGTRTYHRLTCAIEDAGWEIRDCLMWLYGSGFPKSHNFGNKIGNEWLGYGTALKPAYEPIIMAMKSLEGTYVENAHKWGVAGINIDDSRIGTETIKTQEKTKYDSFGVRYPSGCPESFHQGRWPANCLFDQETCKMLDEQNGIGASRFFYCAKASPSERNEGMDKLPFQEAGIKNDSGRGFSESDPHKKIEYKNNHPTVKPIKLMEYLIKLIMPPKDGILLDPFMGSGSTLVAAKNLGYDAVGIEKNAEYCHIARARIFD